MNKTIDIKLTICTKEIAGELWWEFTLPKDVIEHECKKAWEEIMKNGEIVLE